MSAPPVRGYPANTVKSHFVTERLERQASSVERGCHANCMACRGRPEGGLGLRFEAGDDGTVQATFPCEPTFQGHPNRVHGGVIAMVLDATMTHCLFVRGIRGYTGRLNVRYRAPLLLGGTAVVRAWLVREHQPFFELRSDIRKDGEVRALAEAKFYGDPDAAR